MHEHPNTLHQQLSNTLYRQKQHNRPLLETQYFCLTFTASMIFAALLILSTFAGFLVEKQH